MKHNRQHPPARESLFRTTMLVSLVAAVLSALALVAADARSPVNCADRQGCETKSKQVKKVYLLPQGARPRWSPDGRTLVFDRVGEDGYFDLFLMELPSTKLTPLTEGVTGLTTRNHGNAVFHPGGDFIVFISEESEHFGDRRPATGNPGIGLFANLWVMHLKSRRVWKLTDIPIKKRLLDRTPAIATVNPHFDRNGDRVVWTERYEGGGGNWGRWRLKIADFAIRDGVPAIENVSILFTPMRGNYVTSMGFLSANELLLAGNLEGQHVYGMDHYAYDLMSGALRNLQHTPELWEEGACISPDGARIVYMTNAYSTTTFDFNDPDWVSQRMERDYAIMARGGSGQVRLTYLNDPDAPEYLGIPVHVAACSISPDGRWIAATIGLDVGRGKKRRSQLHLGLIKFAE